MNYIPKENQDIFLYSISFFNQFIIILIKYKGNVSFSFVYFISKITNEIKYKFIIFHLFCFLFEEKK